MKEQAGTQTFDNGDVSELQMVGQLLFGSLPNNTSVEEPEAPQMINLGAKIAPESARAWVSDDSQSSTNSTSEFPPLPESAQPVLESSEVRVEEPQSVSSPKRDIRRYASTVCATLIVATLCGLIFVAGMMVNEKGTSEVKSENVAETAQPQSVSPVVPSNPADSFAERTIPELTQIPAVSESFVAPTVVVEEEENFPVFNASVANASSTQPTFAQVNSAVGMNAQNMGDMVSTASEEEDYPTFNANAAMGSQVGTGLEIAANNAAVPTYNAGSTMDEVPVYNGFAGTQVSGSQVASTSYIPAVQPTYASAAPAVGSQVSTSAPRKLAPPTHAPEPVYEEPIPSFNPGLGTNSVSLPVMYH